MVNLGSVEKTEIQSTQFLVLGKDPPEMLDLIDETFYQVGLPRLLSSSVSGRRASRLMTPSLNC